MRQNRRKVKQQISKKRTNKQILTTKLFDDYYEQNKNALYFGYRKQRPKKI